MAVDDLVSASTEVHVYSVFYLPFQKIGSRQKVVLGRPKSWSMASIKSLESLRLTYFEWILVPNSINSKIVLVRFTIRKIQMAHFMIDLDIISVVRDSWKKTLR